MGADNVQGLCFLPFARRAHRLFVKRYGQSFQPFGQEAFHPRDEAVAPGFGFAQAEKVGEPVIAGQLLNMYFLLQVLSHMLGSSPLMDMADRPQATKRP